MNRVYDIFKQYNTSKNKYLHITSNNNVSVSYFHLCLSKGLLSSSSLMGKFP